MQDDSTVEIPAPPDGKQNPEPYGETSRRKKLGSMGIGYAIGGVLGYHYWPTIEAGIDAGLKTLSPMVLFGAILLLLVIKTAIHEFIHAGANHALGLDFQINWELLNPNVSTDSNYVTRGESITTLLTPLVVINSIAYLGMLTATDPITAFVWALIFILNAAGSGSDIYGSLVVGSLPRGTVICTMWDSHRESYIYRPE